MVPGLSAQLKNVKVDERELDRIEAIVLSMTPEERRRPELIKGSRRLRIAKGSGTSVQQVNGLVKQFGPDAEGHEAGRQGQDARPAVPHEEVVAGRPR
jgi:signal recognition particle GTPase